MNYFPRGDGVQVRQKLNRYRVVPRRAGQIDLAALSQISARKAAHSNRMEAREPPGDELLALVQRAVGDDAAQRCTAALRAQGVGAVVDWFVLETADEDLCRDLLSDVAAAEKLTRVQVAKLRLALRGQSARLAF